LLQLRNTLITTDKNVLAGNRKGDLAGSLLIRTFLSVRLRQA
jgi:hypothetical protein